MCRTNVQWFRESISAPNFKTQLIITLIRGKLSCNGFNCKVTHVNVISFITKTGFRDKFYSIIFSLYLTDFSLRNSAIYDPYEGIQKSCIYPSRSQSWRTSLNLLTREVYGLYVSWLKSIFHFYIPFLVCRIKVETSKLTLLFH